MGGAHPALVFQLQEERGGGLVSREVRQAWPACKGILRGGGGLLMSGGLTSLPVEGLQTPSRNPDALAAGGSPHTNPECVWVGGPLQRVRTAGEAR